MRITPEGFRDWKRWLIHQEVRQRWLGHTPKEYIEDTLMMQSTLWSRFEDNVAYFTGTKENAVIGLGGSTKHLLGGSPDRKPQFNSLITPILYALLSEMGGKKSKNIERNLSIVERCAEFAERARYPLERLSFLAKRLATEKGKRGNAITLASPLYIAKED